MVVGQFDPLPTKLLNAKNQVVKKWPGRHSGMLKCFDRRVAQVLDLLSCRFGDPITLPEMAYYVNLSPSRLTSLFRGCGLEAPKSELRRIRMIAADQMLAETCLSVKEIAARTGIADMSHFCRDFKNTYGCSPRRFRELSGQNNQLTSQCAAFYSLNGLSKPATKPFGAPTEAPIARGSL